MEDLQVDWRGVEKLFFDIFVKDGYGQHASQELSFIVSQTLQDAAPLVELVTTKSYDQELDIDQILEQVHLLVNNARLLEKGNRLLMRENTK